MVKKGKKDPNMPKRPLSAFFLFSNDKRAEVKSEHPDMPVSEISKKLGEMWAETSDADKKPYVNKAEEAKVQYKEDMKVYKDNKPEDDDEDEDEEDDEPKKKKRKMKEKDPNAPKKPLTAYFLFLADKRASVKEENPDLNNKELVQELGKLWTALDEKEKKVYTDKHSAEKVKYEKALKEYNAKN